MYRGTLPFIIHSKFPDEDLAAYVGRTLKGDYEVDFIINDVAIEVKSTTNVQKKILSGLIALQEEKICRKYVVISQDS